MGKDEKIIYKNGEWENDVLKIYDYANFCWGNHDAKICLNALTYEMKFILHL